MRAAAYDQEAALAQGVSVGAVFALLVGDRRRRSPRSAGTFVGGRRERRRPTCG